MFFKSMNTKEIINIMPSLKYIQLKNGVSKCSCTLSDIKQAGNKT